MSEQPVNVVVQRTVVCLVLALASAAAGCNGPKLTPVRSADAITSEYEAKIAQAREETSNEVFWPVCEVPPRRGKGCGLLADGLTDEFVAKFMRETCQEDPSANPSQPCRTAFQRAFYARVRERYVHANVDDVDRACASAPSQCASFGLTELKFLASHNAAVWADGKARMEELVAAHEREQSLNARARDVREREAEGQRRVMGALAAGLEGLGSGAQRASTQRSTEVEEEPPPKRPAIHSYAPIGQGSSTPNTRPACSSDFDCGGPGFACSKPVGSYTGTCAKVVNEYGNQVFTGPRTNSIGPGQRQCSLPLDCGLGWKCDQGRCLKM